MSGSLNRNARTNLLTTPLAPSVARPNVVEGTYGLELRRVSIVEVACIFVTGVINIQFLSEREKIIPNTQQHSTQSKNQRDTGVQREDDEM